MLQLQNKVCLIAGATGAIGRAVWKRFQEEGASLALTYLSQGPVPEADDVFQLALNVRDWEEVQDTVDQVVHRFGCVDVLVNCTGVLGPIGPTSSTAAEDWVQAVEINLIGSFYRSRCILIDILLTSHQYDL